VTKAYINYVDFFLPSIKESNLKILLGGKKTQSEAKSIISKIGIINRRISNKNEFSQDLAINSANKIIKKINKDKIDYLIYCTNTPDFLLPSNSCIIHEKLNLKKNAGAFDIILACSGYVYSINIAKALILSGSASNILLITSDTYSKFISKKDTKNRILFGDGSSSTIISGKKQKNSFEILGSLQGTDGSGSNFAIIKGFGNRYRKSKKKDDKFISIDGPGLYNFALEKLPKAFEQFKNKFRVDEKKISYFIFHQANKFMIDGLIQKMKLDKNKVIINLAETGNTTSSSIPIIISR